MQIKIYTLAYDTGAGVGSNVFATEVARDGAFREALLSYAESAHRQRLGEITELDGVMRIFEDLGRLNGARFSTEVHTLEIP